MARHRKIALIKCVDLTAETLRPADVNSPSIAERTSSLYKLTLALTDIKHLAGEANRPTFLNAAKHGESE